MKTKNDTTTAKFTVQITEDPNGRIHMWVMTAEGLSDRELRKVFGGPINFSKREGRSGVSAWGKLHALIAAS
jgi:hypothetical protein